MIKKMISALVGAACMAMLIAGGSMVSMAEEKTVTLEPVSFYGTIEKDGTEQLILNTQEQGEIILHLSDETLILDAVNGFPIGVDGLTDGEGVYAYTSPAMALSLPPQTHAILIVGQIPADFKAPMLERVESLVDESNGTYVVETVSGEEYTIQSDTTMLPYLTRNMVYPTSLLPGTQFLVWTTAAQPEVAEKIVIFADGQIGGNESEEQLPSSPSQVILEEENGSEAKRIPLKKDGWQKEEENWYFYQDDERQKGWILEGGSWYYLNPESGRMLTGFVTVNGNTYYLLEDGRMLTEARTFTPDESGVLH